MPTSTIHIEVAHEIAKIHPEFDTALFYLGSITPDAVNSNGFADKEIRYTSHVRNQDLNIWEDNIKKMYLENKYSYPKDFLSGYIVHLLTDLIHDKYFYLPITKEMDKDNIPKTLQHQLLRNSMLEYGEQVKKEEFYKEIKEKLNNVEGYNIKNITKDQILAWKNYILKENQITVSFNKYITKDQIINLSKKVETSFLEIIK